VLTADGIRIAVFYTKVTTDSSSLSPLRSTPGSPELRVAPPAITRHVDDYANRVHLPHAA
jgi:hypothetical protein